MCQPEASELTHHIRRTGSIAAEFPPPDAHLGSLSLLVSAESAFIAVFTSYSPEMDQIKAAHRG